MSLISSFLTRSCHPIISKNQTFAFCSVSRELIRQRKKDAPPAAIFNQDILLGTIKSAGTTDNVLKLVNTHLSVMNNKHLMQSLRSIFLLQKSGDSNLSTSQVLKHPDFEKLCSNLKNRAGAIELNESIEALKVVCYMGVPSDSTVSQVLLQMIRRQINNLTLQQIIFSDFILSQMQPTPLIEALQIALPIVFDIHLKTKVDKYNVLQLTECLQFAAKKELAGDSIEFLLGNIVNNSDDIEPKLALSVLWSICDLPPDIFFEPVINKMMNSMVVHMDTMSWQDMETTLSKMCSQYNHRYPFYYNDLFCDMCINYVVENDLGFNQAAYLLRRFNKVSHQTDKLLNYITNIVHADPSVIHNADVMVLTSVVYGLAMTDYRPQHWNEFKAILEVTSRFKDNQRKEILWLKLAASLCVLDIYKPDVLEMAMRVNYLHRVLRQGYLSDYENMILIYQAIMTQKKEFAVCLPNISLIEQAVKKLKPVMDYPLEGALEQAFGGEDYVKTRLLTDLYHQIDHAIIMGKEGIPVAFSTNENPQTLEEIDVGPDNQLVAILGLSNLHFTSNNHRLKGTTSLTIKLLESKGYVVVPIQVNKWKELADFEKIPYLVQIVNSKFSHLDAISSVN